MKRLFYIICTLVLLTSCSGSENKNTTPVRDNKYLYGIELIDVQFNGESHEYVKYNNGYGQSLIHWGGM